MATMTQAQKDVALLVQAKLRDAKAALVTAKQALNEAADAMLARMIVEQNASPQIPEAAVRCYDAYGMLEDLAGQVRSIRGRVVKDHRAMSRDLSLTFSDADTVVNGEINGPGGGRRGA